MNVRTLFLLTLIGVVGVFAAINWSAFTAITPLWLLFVTVQAPLGLIMLAVTALAILLALTFVAHLKTTMLLESRQHAREMQAQRKLADAAEASRLTALQQALEHGLHSQSEQLTTTRADLIERMAQTELAVQHQVEQSGNTLAAYIGELEDRLERRDGRHS
jgi:DNA anti-recombination protein RmuC